MTRKSQKSKKSKKSRASRKQSSRTRTSARKTVRRSKRGGNESGSQTGSQPSNHKITYQQAGYIRPPGVEIRCGTCAFFADKTKQLSNCKVVDGTVHDHGCCNLWSHDGKLTTDYECGDKLKKILDW